ncbi:T6SS immunity protein Tli3 family protein [Gilliamella apicola]|uniref:T6SS immunity protein Tli3 family protein n=1 Tax=Gilliamella apicola TaxID=1196095 RepID=UPI002FEE0563
MKKRLIKLLICCIVIPGGLWAFIINFGSNLPERYEETTGLDIPMPEPREGYEIIYPEVIKTSNPNYTASFYYISKKRQVIYRYDADRYLELQGENCEGLIWYHDQAKNIHTRIDKVFFTRNRLPKFNYYNPGKDYIGIPTDDMSAIPFSIDGGKTFYIGNVTSFAAKPSEQVERFIGVDDSPLTLQFNDVDEYMRGFINTITVSGNTGYFILKNDVLFGDTVFWQMFKYPQQKFHSLSGVINTKKNIDLYLNGENMKEVQRFGRYWEIYYKPAYIERISGARNIKLEPYQGWDKIRCEIGAEK